jgi:uncharacterized protein DUF3313
MIMRARFIALALAAAFLALTAAEGARSPTEWDGLVRAEGKRVDLLYLRPGASLAGYSKVMLDPPLVAYDKQWRRDYDRAVTGHFARLTDKEIRTRLDDAQQMLSTAYGNALAAAGYQIATAPDADVLRLSIAVLNVRITAPDVDSAPPMTVVSKDIGSATLVIEARDSLTGQLLGRAVDQELLRDSVPLPRTDASNRGDFKDLFKEWAKLSARGLAELKSAPQPR